jgi:hypothetical protein
MLRDFDDSLGKHGNPLSNPTAGPLAVGRNTCPLSVRTPRFGRSTTSLRSIITAALRPCWRSSTLRRSSLTPSRTTLRNDQRHNGFRPVFGHPFQRGELMDYAEEQRQRWNAGRVREHDWAARSAPRAPTGLEQHTATLFTGANVSASRLAAPPRPVSSHRNERNHPLGQVQRTHTCSVAFVEE